MQNLIRRGFNLGPVPQQDHSTDHSEGKLKDNWQAGFPSKISGVCADQIVQNQGNIEQTESLVSAILDDQSAEELLDQTPYIARLSTHFDPMGAAFNEGDDQEVETVMFDARSDDGQPLEDLWMKVSWLSFHDEDASIRFRFSFGVDLEEDVAADPLRQAAAAKLAETVFPESSIISQNGPLLDLIESVLIDQSPSTNRPKFVERILYFNAPNGGAYLHHDLERGHAGVVYAQVSGSTLWLALPQQRLVEEVAEFIQTKPLPESLNDEAKQELRQLAENENKQTMLSDELNSFANDALIHLINETPNFVQFLIGKGHYRILEAGDVILLPQQQTTNCCWHSVFCLGDEIGQALSFAIR